MNSGRNIVEKVFVNFTNHPSMEWMLEQKKAAERYGAIVDIPFPNVDPKGNEAYITTLAEEYIQRIEQLRPVAVLCQGEFNLAYQVVSKLKEKGILVVAACSERHVQVSEQKKIVTFIFEQFRAY